MKYLGVLAACAVVSLGLVSCGSSSQTHTVPAQKLTPATAGNDYSLNTPSSVEFFDYLNKPSSKSVEIAYIKPNDGPQVEVKSIALEKPSSNFLIDTSACTLGAFTSLFACSVNVTYSAAAAAENTLVITYVTSSKPLATRYTADVPLKGDVISNGTAITVTESEPFYATTSHSISSRLLSFTIRPNTGSVTYDGIDLLLGKNADFTYLQKISSTCVKGEVIAEGTSCHVTYAYKAAAEGVGEYYQNLLTKVHYTVNGERSSYLLLIPAVVTNQVDYVANAENDQVYALPFYPSEYAEFEFNNVGRKTGQDELAMAASMSRLYILTAKDSTGDVSVYNTVSHTAPVLVATYSLTDLGAHPAMALAYDHGTEHLNLYVASDNEPIQVWDTTTEKEVGTINPGLTGTTGYQLGSVQFVREDGEGNDILPTVYVSSTAGKAFNLIDPETEAVEDGGAYSYDQLASDNYVSDAAELTNVDGVPLFYLTEFHLPEVSVPFLAPDVPQGASDIQFSLNYDQTPLTYTSEGVGYLAWFSMAEDNPENQGTWGYYELTLPYPNDRIAIGNTIYNTIYNKASTAKIDMGAPLVKHRSLA